MTRFKMTLRFDEDDLQALDNPHGEFRGCHGTTELPAALASEFRALLQSLGSDAVITCRVDTDGCGAVVPDVVA
jgi:hypothetical protein